MPPTRCWLGLEHLDATVGTLDRLTTVVTSAIAGIEQSGGTVRDVQFTGMVDSTVLIAILYQAPNGLAQMD